VLAKLPTEQLVEMTQDRVIGLFDEYIETFMGAESTETSSGGKGDTTVEALRKARALLEQWPITSHAPVALVQAARDFLKSCGLLEPEEGWDAWEGPGDELDTRPELPSPRALRPEPMTVDAWASWRGPGELVDGVLVEEEAATPLHDAVVARLLDVFSAWASSHGARAFGPDHKLVVSESGGRKPDISVYVASDRLEGDGATSRRPPSLVVEVLSPGKIDERRDLVTKAREYAKLGVRFYWCVDPLARQINCMQRLPDGRWLVTWIATDGRFAVSNFEDLVLDLDALWAEEAAP
jgi:Uma2 family endonuclease